MPTLPRSVVRPSLYWLAPVLLIGSVSAAVPAGAQSRLVDAARRAAEARARHGTPDKVYTSSDVPVAPLARPRLVLPPSTPAEPSLEEALAQALEREQQLLERQPRERPSTGTGTSGDTSRTDRRRSPPGGIPLWLAYATPYVPYRGARGTRAPDRNSDAEGRTEHQAVIKRPPVTGDHPIRPTRPVPARNGYAESSRPLNYVAPGIPAPSALGARRAGSTPLATGVRGSGAGSRMATRTTPRR